MAVPTFRSAILPRTSLIELPFYDNFELFHKQLDRDRAIVSLKLVNWTAIRTFFHVPGFSHFFRW